MDIGRTDGVGGPGRVDGPQRIQRAIPPQYTQGAHATDKVDISEKAGMISKALGLPEVRMERIAEIKKLIQTGRFDTDLRLQGALARFMAENRDL